MSLIKQNKQRSLISTIGLNISLLIITLVVILPVAWLVLVSFKDIRHIFSLKDFFIFTTDNYKNVFGIAQGFAQEYTTATSILPALKNSIIAVSISTALCIFLGALGGYGLGRFQFKGNKDLSFFILSLKMTPPIVALIAFYLIFSKLQLMDTVLGLIWVYTSFNLPFAIWMLRSGFETIPRELDEAALIDGCSWMSSFLRIDLPLVLPHLASTAVMCFIFSWNEFLFAVTLTSRRAPTITVGVAKYMTQVEIEWGSLCAAGVTASAITLIMAFFIQRYIVEGLTFGAVKG